MKGGPVWLEKWKEKAEQLEREIRALWVAYQDRRTPWYARLVSAMVVGYAVSPIDLIPDFIPVIGCLDDLIIVPAGIALALRLIPTEVMADARNKAREQMASKEPINWWVTGAIILVWLVVIGWVGWWLYSVFTHK